MTYPDGDWLADLEPTGWEREQVAQALEEVADDPGGYDPDGPWHDGVPSLDDAFAQMDQANALNGQRIAEDITDGLARRPSAEDKLVRAMRRIEARTYTPAPQPGYDPGGREDACGPLDEFGRCAAAFHVKGCHQTVEASAATGDADAAHAWRETMLGYTLSPEILGYELASPGDGDDWQADALLAPPFGGQDVAVREQVLTYLGEPGGAALKPAWSSRQPLPDVSGVRAALGLQEAAMTVRRVITGIDVLWDGGMQHLSRGTILDVPAGSELETAIGTGNLADLSDPVAAAAAAEQAGASN